MNLGHARIRPASSTGRSAAAAVSHAPKFSRSAASLAKSRRRRGGGFPRGPVGTLGVRTITAGRWSDSQLPIRLSSASPSAAAAAQPSRPRPPGRPTGCAKPTALAPMYQRSRRAAELWPNRVIDLELGLWCRATSTSCLPRQVCQKSPAESRPAAARRPAPPASSVSRSTLGSVTKFQSPAASGVRPRLAQSRWSGMSRL